MTSNARKINELERLLERESVMESGGVWTPYTPTVTAPSGTFTTVTASGKFAMSGKTVHFKILVVVTDKGTAAGYVNATLPVAPFGAYREAMAGVSMVTATGNLYSDLVCYIATNILRIYDGAGGNPAVNGNSLIITGTYEAA